MAEQTYCCDSEWEELLQNLKQYHEQQLDTLHQGVEKIRVLLEHPNGFHAEQTSKKMQMVLDCMEQEIQPEMEALFQESEIGIKDFLDAIRGVDERR